MGRHRECSPKDQYRFSNEELRVLRQCNRDSFFQRCIPIASILGIGTYYGVHSGYLKPHARWGAAPKVTVAVIVGYFLGKFSYQSKCTEMIMQLPNSKLAEMLRQRKRQGGFQESITMDPGFPMPSFAETETYSDVGPHHDLDTDRPYNEGLDDSHRPTLDSPSFEEDSSLPPGTQHRSATYEELRRKNREEYEQKKTKPFRGITTPEDIPTAVHPRGPPPDSTPSPPPTWNQEKNRYGDVWEK
ncbi:OCIA domain-containing protein 1 isoform X2 [Periplaneta americana]|uniref:OCIA domain-containing protein 1 isoform X2 n=1 Tax=Periplaneta americana TaxID=6978 RepID=UPI0037E850D7